MLRCRFAGFELARALWFAGAWEVAPKAFSTTKGKNKKRMRKIRARRARVKEEPVDGRLYGLEDSFPQSLDPHRFEVSRILRDSAVRDVASTSPHTFFSDIERLKGFVPHITLAQYEQYFPYFFREDRLHIIQIVAGYTYCKAFNTDLADSTNRIEKEDLKVIHLLGAYLLTVKDRVLQHPDWDLERFRIELNRVAEYFPDWMNWMQSGWNEFYCSAESMENIIVNDDMFLERVNKLAAHGERWDAFRDVEGYYFPILNYTDGEFNELCKRYPILYDVALYVSDNENEELNEMSIPGAVMCLHGAWERCKSEFKNSFSLFYRSLAEMAATCPQTIHRIVNDEMPIPRGVGIVDLIHGKFPHDDSDVEDIILGDGVYTEREMHTARKEIEKRRRPLVKPLTKEEMQDPDEDKRVPPNGLFEDYEAFKEKKAIIKKKLLDMSSEEYSRSLIYAGSSDGLPFPDPRKWPNIVAKGPSIHEDFEQHWYNFSEGQGRKEDLHPMIDRSVQDSSSDNESDLLDIEAQLRFDGGRHVRDDDPPKADDDDDDVERQYNSGEPINISDDEHYEENNESGSSSDYEAGTDEYKKVVPRVESPLEMYGGAFGTDASAYFPEKEIEFGDGHSEEKGKGESSEDFGTGLEEFSESGDEELINEERKYRRERRQSRRFGNRA